MDISLLQSSSNSIGSVYIIYDYLYNKDYLNFLRETVSDAVDNKPQNRTTNVKAKSTDWRSLLEINEMNNFHMRVLHTLKIIYKLRTLNPTSVVEFSLQESWGMKHKKGDYTAEHTHIPIPWSGAFYIDVPCDNTYMNFADYNSTVKLQSNMLILFPGTTKHGVSRHTSDKERISMAFNITWKR